MSDQILEELIKIRQLLERMQPPIPVVRDNWGTVNTHKPDCGCQQCLRESILS